jgi:hypothetical protein
MKIFQTIYAHQLTIESCTLVKLLAINTFEKKAQRRPTSKPKPKAIPLKHSVKEHLTF